MLLALSNTSHGTCRRALSWLSVCVVLLATGRAEEHRATRLGNPATRFAAPLTSPQDLRSRFQDENLKPDIAAVLRQWGWAGDIQDLLRAAQTAEIADVHIAVGTRLPFMSSRDHGRPICLRNVLWAGKQPAPAFAFEFDSRGRHYRCLTPKACSNFLVEDLGPELQPALEISCITPGEILFGRPLPVCLRLRNAGKKAAANAAVSLAIPVGLTCTNATQGGVAADSHVVWTLESVGPGTVKELCAVFSVAEPGLYRFEADVQGGAQAGPHTACPVKVTGLPAILIDAVDLADPVEVGNEVIYEIRVTNQGSVPETNVRLACRLPEEEEFVSGDGITAISLRDSIVVTDALPNLPSKQVAVWRVVVRAMKPGAILFRIELTCDQFREPIHEEESTHLY